MGTHLCPNAPNPKRPEATRAYSFSFGHRHSEFGSARYSQNSSGTPSHLSIPVFRRPRDTLLYHQREGGHHCFHIHRHLCCDIRHADHPSLFPSQLSISYPDVENLVVYITRFPLVPFLLLSSTITTTPCLASAT